jgi:hypothetical protein
MASRIIEDLYGYYKVADKKYYNKLEAFREALPNGWWPHWNFNEDEFSQHDWSIEPKESLEELYRQRAQQLRDDYEYVILWYSGGSDSENILRVCLRHNIHIDEIWHRSSYERHNRRDSSTDTNNQANETRFTTIPKLKEYQKLMPRTKIRFFDAMEEGIAEWKKGGFSPYETNYFNPVMPAKVHSHKYNQHDESKKTCKILGVDKPRIRFADDKYWCFFQDNWVNTHMMYSRLHNISAERDELFYWHPDAIRIMIKQAHLVKNFFKNNPDWHGLLENYEFGGYDLRNKYESLVRSIVYPDLDQKVFQVSKPVNDIAHGEFYWFFSEGTGQAYKNWITLAQDYKDEIKKIYATAGAQTAMSQLGEYGRMTAKKKHNFKQTISKIGNSDFEICELPGAQSRTYCLGK